ncbi:HEAT repeat domain-containing protein [Actinomadura macrotermitis]|uniref:HEAT repeat domain-containing protein n=1 Tax=Actinomadura macrotermitis TaxID=2585200 RepID=A0A7K0C5V5_9ACTN|nr:HEAT repeat domain-containing protein [Actinomadura macrotermitis]MQY08841.1 hypothetical protein [Actinomadura macrotermitis]
MDDSLTAAVNRHSATWSTDVLKALLTSADPRMRRLGLVTLAERGVDEQVECAKSLPSTLEESPEAALAQARLYLRLHAHVGAWPRWRAADMPVSVRIAWLRAEIAARPRTVRDEPARELLYQAVQGIGAAELDDPEALAGELAARDDVVLRAEALRITREAMRAALIVPARARALIAGLAEGNEDALRELAEPWAALDPLPRERLERFVATGPADAAAEVAARHGHRDLLWDIAADSDRPPALRARALELLGGLADREDVADLVALATEDPLLLAGPALRCLVGMHRRGHFPGDAAVAAIVDLALADHSVPAGDVATVLFTCRRETVRVLAGRGADARVLELLVALDAQGGGELGVGGIVAGLLDIAAEPALRAIRELRHLGAEQAVLDALPRAPEAALAALEAVGGERTVAALRAGLGIDGGQIAPHLRSVRHRALELLWHLSEAAERRSLLGRLDPRDLPPRIAMDLGGPDEAELALLRAALDPDEPLDALCRLARNGGPDIVPALTDLLLRVVSDLATGWIQGEEPVVPQEAMAAVRELGANLHRRGRIRPHCLLDAANAAEAGNALLASMALDLLDRPDLVPVEQMILLGLLKETPYRRIRARVHPLLRHRDRHVRKQVIALLAGDARALSASLIPLTAAADAQTVRQALLALASARADWAAGAIAGCLNHSNMNVKKTAAAALADASAPVAVPTLLSWLGRHDNPGLREAIVAALRAILGEAFAVTVTAAAECAPDDRTRALLLDVLKEEKRTANPEAAMPHGWDREVALSLVDEHERDGTMPRDSKPLRPMLDRWLELAESAPRGPVLRFVLRLCPPPWSDSEVEVVARSAQMLASGLAEIGDEHRPGLLALLEAAVPKLGAAEASEVAAQVRALPPGQAGGKGMLPLLRRCGAVPTRDDLDRALTAARLGPNPWRAEEAVLREAFGVGPDVPAEGSRQQIHELIRQYGEAEAREALLDQMLALQPLDAPPWTVAEHAGRPREPERTPQDGDLDQPRSAAQRARLLALLDAPEQARRETAARALLNWPEPQIRREVLRAFLHGKVTLLATADLARALEPDDLKDTDGERAAALAARLEPADLAKFVPSLLTLWEQGAPATRAAAWQALRRAAPDTVADALSERLDAGDWGMLDLIAGVPLLRTDVLTRAVRRLREEGRDDLADAIVLLDGPLRPPGAAAQDAASLAALRERAPAADTAPTRAELFRQARDGDPEEIRRALTLLAERHEDAGAAADPEFEELLVASIGHPAARVRLHAHRICRRVLDRPAYLAQTARLLDDPRPDVVRSAIMTLGHAGWEPAVPALVGLLTHARPPVRRAAGQGLVLLGAAAVPALTHAAGRARPDRRPVYTGVLEAIAARDQAC